MNSIGGLGEEEWSKDLSPATFTHVAKPSLAEVDDERMRSLLRYRFHSYPLQNRTEADIAQARTNFHTPLVDSVARVATLATFRLIR